MSNLVLFADYMNTQSSRNLAREYSDTVVTNGNFDSDVAGWGKGNANLVWDSDGFCEIVCTGGTIRISQAAILTIGKRYRVTFKAKSAITQKPYFHGAHMSDIVYTVRPTLSTEWQIYEFYGTTLNANFYLYLFSGGLGDQVDIDNIAVTEVLESEDTDILYKHGLGAEFNGASSVINYGNPNILQLASQFTIEMVVACNKTGANYEVFCGKWVGADACYMIQYFEGTQIPLFYVWKSGVNNNVSFIKAMTDGHFHHLIAVNDGTDLITYFDGEYTSTGVGKGGLIDNDPADFAVGGRAGGGRHTDGRIKYTRIYKGKAFTALEARQSYQAVVDGGYLNA